MREGDRGIERQRKEGWGEVNKKGVWGKGEGGKRNGTKWKEFGNKNGNRVEGGSRNEGVKGRWKAGRTDSGLGWREEVKMKGLRERKEERE